MDDLWMLRSNTGPMPFGIIEMLPDNMRPSDEVISYAKEMYTKVTKPDTVRAWNGEVIFGYYFKRNCVTCLNELIFSEGRNMRWECE